MANILAAGAGASEGLETLLTRLDREKVIAESQRSNMADEDFKQKNLDETMKLRMATEADAAASRRDVHALGEQTATRSILGMRPIGATVAPETMKHEMATGADSSFYDQQPEKQVSKLSGFSTLPGGDTPATGQLTRTPEKSPMNAPGEIKFKGTQGGIEKSTTDAAAQTARTAQLEIAAQNANSATERAYYQNQLAEANAKLSDARTAHVGDAKPLPANTADNMAGLNVAEVEGVKVLKSLHDGGLDMSDNPIDPRWNKFMVTTLKMAPADWRKADIQQRTAAINAMLTRGLMGSRPSQYVAEIIQQHLPQGDMTGKQLAHVLHNVLGQAGERRTEIESLTGREAGALTPKSGMTYRQYLDSGGASDPQGGQGRSSGPLPAGVTVRPR